MTRSLQIVIALLVAMLLCCSAARTTAFLPEQGALFEQALAEVGLSPEDVRISDADLGLWGGDKYRLNLHRFLYDNPWKTSAYTRSLTAGLLRNQDNLGSLTTSAFQRLDCGVRLGLVGDELAQEKARVEELGSQALAFALSELTGRQPGYYCWIPEEQQRDFAEDPVEEAPSTPSQLPRAMPTELQQDYARLPLEVQQAAALVLFTAPRIVRYREEALTKPILELGLNPQEVFDRVYAYTINTFEEEDGTSGSEVADDLDDVLLIEALMDHVDWDLLSAGATLAAITAQSAQQMMAEISDTPGHGNSLFETRTPLGMVNILSGPMDPGSIYRDSDILLWIDSHGNDTLWTAPASTPGYDHPLSILIDLQGNDSYSGSSREDRPGVASGVFGYGVLIDAGGDDRYQATYGGAGFGLFGYGLLADLAGNDSYDGGGNIQGSGAMGAGVLLDCDGDDMYHAFKYSQGFGGTRGAGLLIDLAGHDSYVADMNEHFNGGLYGPDHHVHFCQGSAFGRRADFTDGHSWAGGFGLLCDGAGNDRYIGDCYVQGNSYWYAVGMLVDKEGNDSYSCAQYSQASAPHFSAGILQDDSGDDRYIVTRRQSMGHGRDWSLAWFEDAAGDDWYQGARTTLGTSHVNSISVFWDRAGDDTYIARGPSFGESELDLGGSPRDWLLTLGLFVDGGGTDSYFLLPGDESYAGSDEYVGEISDTSALQPLEFAGNGKLWVKTRPGADSLGYCGIGIDAP